MHDELISHEVDFEMWGIVCFINDGEIRCLWSALVGMCAFC